MDRVKHEFGGFRTRAKLERVSAYLSHFVRETGADFRTIYFDAFAGSGTVDHRGSKPSTVPGFLDLREPPLEGSARQALRTEPPFDRYVFVDLNADHCRELKRMVEGFPRLKHRVPVKKGDANEQVARFCRATDWSRSRAVFILDPYAMDVIWATIEAIAKTGAADLWYLFPLSKTLRSLPRNQEPSAAKSASLDRFFGDRGLSELLYHRREKTGLVGPPTMVTSRPRGGKPIKWYFLERLRSVFEWVSEKPLRLFAHNMTELFHLHFASSIPGKRKAYDTVQKILSIPGTARNFPARFGALMADKQANEHEGD